jgi:hypothetical protein
MVKAHLVIVSRREEKVGDAIRIPAQRLPRELKTGS